MRTSLHRTQEDLHRTNEYLDQRVAARTKELQNSNNQLKQEITRRIQVEEQIKTSLREKEVLHREIHHRVKNNMQIIISLMRLQSDNVKEKQYTDMLKESQGRIRSMALIHEKLYQSKQFTDININEYVKSLVNDLFRSYGVDSSRIIAKIRIKDVSLDLESAIPCGLILNELVSNSLKYAFPNDQKGKINIDFRQSNQEDFELAISDDGVGLPEKLDFKNTKSFGLRMVRSLIEHQLSGKIQLNQEEGTQYHIQFKQQVHQRI